MREPCLDYFYGDEVKINSFCRLPRIFVTDEFYRAIPLEIKVLYSVMLDRVAISMRNNWREDGRVFIYFTLNEAMRLVHVGKHKAIRLFDRMELLGLIRRRKQERGKPTCIFVREFAEVGYAEEVSVEDATDCDGTEDESVDIPMETEDIAETSATVAETNGTPAQIDEPDTCGDAASETPAPAESAISGLLRECAVGVRRLGDLLLGGDAPGGQTSRNQTSRLLLSGSLDFPNRNPNYIYKRYIKYADYNQSIHQEGTALYEEGNSEQARAARKEKHLENLRGLIQDDVDYEGLMRDYPNRREEIAGYVEIMAQCCCSDRREIRIDQQDFPQACVRSRFEKLERRHMEYVLKCMAHIPPNIRNVRAYALSTLYNSYAILQRGPISEKRRKKARKRYKNWHNADE